MCKLVVSMKSKLIKIVYTTVYHCGFYFSISTSHSMPSYKPETKRSLIKKICILLTPTYLRHFKQNTLKYSMVCRWSHSSVESLRFHPQAWPVLNPTCSRKWGWGRRRVYLRLAVFEVHRRIRPPCADCLKSRLHRWCNPSYRSSSASALELLIVLPGPIHWI